MELENLTAQLALYLDTDFDPTGATILSRTHALFNYQLINKISSDSASTGQQYLPALKALKFSSTLLLPKPRHFYSLQSSL